MFRPLFHFWVLGDVQMPKETRAAIPTVNTVDTDERGLLVSSAMAIGSIGFARVPDPLPTVSAPIDSI